MKQHCSSSYGKGGKSKIFSNIFKLFFVKQRSSHLGRDRSQRYPAANGLRQVADNSAPAHL